MFKAFTKTLTLFAPKNLSPAINSIQKTSESLFKTESKLALEEIEQLWKEGQLKKALSKIDEVESKYPDCSKAVKHYRGKIGTELLEKSENLPKNNF